MKGHDPSGEEPVPNVLEPGGLEQPGELGRPGEAPHAGRQVRVRRAAGENLAGERNENVEPQPVEGPQNAPRPRDLEDPEPAAAVEYAPKLSQPFFDVGNVPDPESDGCRVEGVVREGQLQQVALDPAHVGPFSLRALQHGLGEIQPGHAPARMRGGDREIARPAAGVQYPVAGPDYRLCRQPAPAPVEPSRHQPVHRVVDRRDAIEHALHLGRLEPAALEARLAPRRLRYRIRRRQDRVAAGAHSPQPLTSVCSTPSWSRQRATMKSTRSSTFSAPW